MPCSRASRLMYSTLSGAGSASGSSSWTTICSRSCAICDESMRTTCSFTPRWRATWRAYGRSSAMPRSRTPPVSIVKHSICGASSRAMATTALESTPPDKNAPTGTSATIWRWTAVRSDCSTRRTASSGPTSIGSAGHVEGAQVHRRTMRQSFTRRASPGPSRRTPRIGVAPPGLQRYPSVRKSDATSIVAGIVPVRVSAFSSLANRNPSAV